MMSYRSSSDTRTLLVPDLDRLSMLCNEWVPPKRYVPPYCPAHINRLQLVYAFGDPSALPALQERLCAIQAVLRTASRIVTSTPPSMSPLPGAAILEPPTDRSPGAFCGLRLLPGDSLTAVLPNLRLRLAESLLDKPPYELRWLRNHPLRVRVVRLFLTTYLASRERHWRGYERHSVVLTSQYRFPSAFAVMMLTTMTSFCLHPCLCPLATQVVPPALFPTTRKARTVDGEA